MTTVCRSCKAPLLWAETEQGHKIPLDADPYTGSDPRGLFVLRGERPTAVAVGPATFLGEPLYRTHFVTCPNAKEHRR